MRATVRLVAAMLLLGSAAYPQLADGQIDNQPKTCQEYCDERADEACKTLSESACRAYVSGCLLGCGWAD